MPPVVRAQLDYYAVLEIAPSVDAIEINAAFRRLAWRYHPDRNPAPGATLQFQDINEAHQVLSDPERRAEYDAKWHPHRCADRPPTRPISRSHSHRGSHRRRRVRTVLLTLFAFVFVSSAWVVILRCHDARRIRDVRLLPSTRRRRSTRTLSQGCAISMEMFPVTYIDERGRRSHGMGNRCPQLLGRINLGVECARPASRSAPSATRAGVLSSLD